MGTITAMRQPSASLTETNSRNYHMADLSLLTPAGRRRALIRLARDEGRCLGKLGMEPANKPVFVFMQDNGDAIAASKLLCLMAAAESMSIQVMDPCVQQDAMGRQIGYVVLASMYGGTQCLGSGATPEEAQQAALPWLETMVGSMVMSLEDWAVVVKDLPELPGTRKAPVQWAQLRTARLTRRTLRNGWFEWTMDLSSRYERIRMRQARELLDAGASVRLASVRTKRHMVCEMNVIEVEGEIYASFHDLVLAARHGIDVMQIRPWPTYEANNYVLLRETHRYMRANGWRKLWNGEMAEEHRTVRLAHSTQWVKDVPIPFETPLPLSDEEQLQAARELGVLDDEVSPLEGPFEPLAPEQGVTALSSS